MDEIDRVVLKDNGFEGTKNSKKLPLSPVGIPPSGLLSTEIIHRKIRPKHAATKKFLIEPWKDEIMRFFEEMLF